MVDGLMRGPIVAGLLLVAAGSAEAGAPAGAPNTDAFLAACIADPVVTDEPGFAASGGKATPQLYCECIAGKFKEKKVSQSDIDMMTKMHKDEITDEDAASYPTLEDLMAKNENFEDECKASLGMPSSDNDDEEGPPVNEEDIPQDE
jgi:hypothetical protein